VGENSKTVQKRYLKALEAGRNEFEILLGQFDELEEHFADREILEFLRRFRSKELEIQPGYDGEYGSISLKRNKG
jgi:PHP family Zn ribbon phosphoesterase